MSEPLGHLELDERHDRHLVLAEPIVGRRLLHAHRLADAHEQLERDPGSVADLSERLPGEGREPLVRGRVHEVERQGALLDRSGHALERDPGVLERASHQHAAQVAAREAARLRGGEDAEIDQPIDVVRRRPRLARRRLRADTRSREGAYCCFTLGGSNQALPRTRSGASPTARGRSRASGRGRSTRGAPPRPRSW